MKRQPRVPCRGGARPGSGIRLLETVQQGGWGNAPDRVPGAMPQAPTFKWTHYPWAWTSRSNHGPSERWPWHTTRSLPRLPRQQRNDLDGGEDLVRRMIRLAAEIVPNTLSTAQILAA